METSEINNSEMLNIVKTSVVKKSALEEARRLIDEAESQQIDDTKKTSTKLCSYPPKDYTSMTAHSSYESSLVVLFRHIRMAMLRHKWESVVEYLIIFHKQIDILKKSSAYYDYHFMFLKNATHIVLRNHPKSTPALIDRFQYLTQLRTFDAQIYSILDELFDNQGE